MSPEDKLAQMCNQIDLLLPTHLILQELAVVAKHNGRDMGNYVPMLWHIFRQNNFKSLHEEWDSLVWGWIRSSPSLAVWRTKTNLWK